MPAARRGVARRIPRPALLALALTRELHVGLGLGVRDALRLAIALLAEEGGGEWRDGAIRLVLDRGALERALDERLRVALESAPAPRRGRPPGRGRGK